jgi:hypothetical protein
VQFATAGGIRASFEGVPDAPRGAHLDRRARENSRRRFAGKARDLLRRAPGLGHLSSKTLDRQAMSCYADLVPTSGAEGKRKGEIEMKRKKVALTGLMALALLATSVFVAGGAQASPDDGKATHQFECLKKHKGTEMVHCHGTGLPIAVHGGTETLHTFKAGFATVQCAKTEFHVTTIESGTSANAPTEPTYNECIANPGALTTHVKINTCHYKFYAEKLIASPKTEDEFEGSAAISCPGAVKSITVEITEGGVNRCIIHVPEQGTIKPIFFRNNTVTGDVSVEASNAAVTGVFTPVGGGLLAKCGVLSENATTRYTGNVTVTATDPAGNPVAVQVSTSHLP